MECSTWLGSYPSLGGGARGKSPLLPCSSAQIGVAGQSHWPYGMPNMVGLLPLSWRRCKGEITSAPLLLCTNRGSRPIPLAVWNAQHGWASTPLGGGARGKSPLLPCSSAQIGVAGQSHWPYGMPNMVGLLPLLAEVQGGNRLMVKEVR